MVWVLSLETQHYWGIDKLLREWTWYLMIEEAWKEVSGRSHVRECSKRGFHSLHKKQQHHEWRVAILTGGLWWGWPVDSPDPQERHKRQEICKGRGDRQRTLGTGGFCFRFSKVRASATHLIVESVTWADFCRPQWRKVLFIRRKTPNRVHCVDGECWKPGAAKEHFITLILFISIPSDFFFHNLVYNLGNQGINVRMP